MSKIGKLVLSIVACLTPMVGLAAPTAHASVGNIFTKVYYRNPNRVFIYANSGTSHAGFRAFISCANNYSYTGGWQTQPGPWYGSGASCGSELISQAYVIFN